MRRASHSTYFDFLRANVRAALCSINQGRYPLHRQTIIPSQAEQATDRAPQALFPHFVSFHL
jgi:hypothetical protein